MGDYQDRIDIDRLYSLVWDNESNRLLLLTKEEFESFKNDLENDYFNKGETDGRYALINHVHPYTTVAEVNEMIVDVITSGVVDLTGYLQKSTATGKEDYTIDQLLSEKADGSSLTSHINNSTDAHGINSKVGVSHLSDSSAHSSLFNGKVGTSHLTDNSAHSTLFGNKADKTGGVAQVTDANANNYSNIGSMSSGATQQTINGKINTALGGKADSNHSTPQATESAFGHVKLSDTYNSRVGDADDGIGASQLALWVVYTLLTSVSHDIKNGHYHGNINSDGTILNASPVSFSKYDVPLVSDTSNSRKIERGYVPTLYIKDDSAYSNIGSSANDTQQAINGAIDTALTGKVGTSHLTDSSAHSSLFANKQNVLSVSRETYTVLDYGTGRVTFFKYGDIVICDYFVNYTSDSTANDHSGICSVPFGYTPSTTIYNGVNYPIQSNSDASTYQTRDVFSAIERYNNEWYLVFFTSITSTSCNVRGQLMWFTD